MIEEHEEVGDHQQRTEEEEDLQGNQEMMEGEEEELRELH